MGRFSLARLVLCARYERLSSEDYLRLGLCQPGSCEDCTAGQGHYVKNDCTVQTKKPAPLLLNNQIEECDSSSTSKLVPSHLPSPSPPLKTIVNNLHSQNNNANRDSHGSSITIANNNNNNINDINSHNITCNKCKELVVNSVRGGAGHVDCWQQNKSSTPSTCDEKNLKMKPAANSNTRKAGWVNLAFVDPVADRSSWYQPYLSRELAVKILVDCPVGSFIVRNSLTHGSSNCLALTVRVPRSFNGTGILHYLIQVTEAGCYQIRGFAKSFATVSGLVVHHTVMKESLPCRLVISPEEENEATSSCLVSGRESDFADLDSDPEYPELIDRLREEFAL